MVLMVFETLGKLMVLLMILKIIGKLLLFEGRQKEKMVLIVLETIRKVLPAEHSRAHVSTSTPSVSETVDLCFFLYPNLNS